MKTLKNYIKESLSLDMKLNETSLLDIEGTIKDNDEVIKKSIEKWIKNNFYVKQLKISKNQNSGGKYEASALSVLVNNKNITSLTNELFVWNEVKSHFDCSYCNNLTSLEGAPKEVGGDFCCGACEKLTSLEGVPQKVGRNFDCACCTKLTSLEGAPKEINGDFICCACEKLTSLEHAPQKVGGKFDCSRCERLESLENAPKEVGGRFDCSDCYKLTSLEGAPEKVGGDFWCLRCEVPSLKGAPKEVGGDFSCWQCSELTSLEGAPEKVGGEFSCHMCHGIISLKGAPKEIGGNFDCSFCSELKSLIHVPKCKDIEVSIATGFSLEKYTSNIKHSDGSGRYFSARYEDIVSSPRYKQELANEEALLKTKSKLKARHQDENTSSNGQVATNVNTLDILKAKESRNI